MCHNRLYVIHPAAVRLGVTVEQYFLQRMIFYPVDLMLGDNREEFVIDMQGTTQTSSVPAAVYAHRKAMRISQSP